MELQPLAKSLYSTENQTIPFVSFSNLNPQDRSNEHKYDSNAIQVKNVEGVQIGLIPRQIAAKFAPYMVGNKKKYLDEHSLT